MAGRCERSRGLWIVSAWLVAAAACEQGEPSAGEAEEAAGEPAAARASQGASGAEEAAAAEPDPLPDPCALLTASVVREVLGLGTDARLRQRRNDLRPHPRCAYRWKKEDWKEIDARNRELLAEQVQKRIRSMREDKRAGGPPLSIEPTENEVALLLRPRDSGEAAETAFDPDAERLEGLGEAAGWSEEDRRLVVLGGDRVWHVRVSVHQEAPKDREAARALAERLLGASNGE